MKTKRKLPSPELILACLILPLCVATSGCFIIPSKSTQNICISPDGRKTAYSVMDQIILIHLPMISLIQSDWVHWQDKDNQWWPNGMKVASGVTTWDKRVGSWSHPEHIVFSPDSAKIAVSMPAGLLVIDLKTRKVTKLTGPGGSTLAWVGNDELVYDRCARVSGETKLTVYRHGINQGDQRRVIYQCDDANFFPGLDCSSDGRHLTIPNRANDAFDIVELKTGKVIWTERLIEGDFQGIVWASDSSAVAYAVCVGTPTKDVTKTYVAHISVLDIATKKARRSKLDCVNMKRMAHHFDGCKLQWTVDGKHLIVNSQYFHNHLLMDIQTGSFTSLKDPITEHFKQELHPEWHVDIQPFTKPGWLWLKGPDKKHYALNYAANRFVHISSANEIMPCPGGERIVELDKDDNISIRKIPATLFTPK